MFCSLVASLVLLVVANSQNVVLPTPEQVAYQTREIVALTHFNMGTYYGDSDPSCNSLNWDESGNPLNFNPYLLNISNWVESYKNLGAKSAVLTAKHGCGFCLWPTNVIIPSTGKLYNYSQPFSSYTENDIIKLFVNTLQENNIGTGFYYSLTNNFYLNVYQHYVQNTTLLPGQQNVTQQQFEDIAIQQLTELFTLYGNLTEFWFDGGTSDLSDRVTNLISEYQPQMVVFNGQQVSQSPIKWVGTETGMPTDPIWSLGCDSGSGDPNSNVWCPAGCDTTLQDGDSWFYVNNIGIRDLAALIKVYHDTVGSNGVLEMDFAPDTTGNIHPNQAQRYKEFGDWIRDCYGKSIVNINNQILNGTSNGNNNLTLELSFNNVNSGTIFDRIMLQEDINYGERIRSYKVYLNNNILSSGTAVGHKNIILLKNNVTINSNDNLILDINNWVGDKVYMLNVAVFNPCPNS